MHTSVEYSTKKTKKSTVYLIHTLRGHVVLTRIYRTHSKKDITHQQLSS